MAMTSSLAMAPFSVVLPAKDAARARGYWERVVGVETMDGPAPGMFMGKAGMGSQFLMYETPLEPTKATTAAFVVSDLAATMAEMRGRGMVFEEYDMPGLKTMDGMADMGHGSRGAWFVDTEGNTINIVQM